MPDIEIGELRRDELPAAAALVARAYRDTPWMIALIGDDPDVRERVLVAAQGLRLSPLTPPAIGARQSGNVVGACGADPPGGASRPPEDFATLLQTANEADPAILGRLQQMMTEMGSHAPSEPHWHLGPVGVHIEAQKQGIGSRMLARFCETLDERGDIAFLETERPEFARLYEKFGWVTVEEAKVLGVTGWFMLRHPQR
jgi:ribosomal protein S18 acetylase RimI-like enzyme